MDQVLIDGVTETVEEHRRNQQRHEKIKILTPKGGVLGHWGVSCIGVNRGQPIGGFLRVLCFNSVGHARALA